MSEAPQTPETSSPSLSTRPSPLASLAERRATQQRRFGLMLVASLFLHLFAFAAWALFPHSDHRAVNLDDDAVVKARLVKLGKPRDEKLLPRLPTSTPPPSAQKKSTPTPETTPQKPDKESVEPSKKSASDILNQFKNENTKPKDIKDIIKDRIGEESDEGQEFGDKDGSALDGAVVDSYFARVTARIQNAMEVSSVLTDEELVRAKAKLCLTIGEDGALSAITIQKSSGSAVFDSDVVAAANRASPAPAPPPPARQRAAAGVCFNFCPKSCS